MMLYFDNILENEATLPACSFIAAVVSIVQYCMLTPGLYVVIHFVLCAAKELIYFYNRRCPARFEFTEKKEKYREEKRVGCGMQLIAACRKELKQKRESEKRVGSFLLLLASFNIGIRYSFFAGRDGRNWSPQTARCRGRRRRFKIQFLCLIIYYFLSAME